MDTCVDSKVPPWKIELINRRRIRNNQSKCTSGGGYGNSEQVKPVQWTWSPTTQHFLQQQQTNAVQTSQQQQSVVGAACPNMRLLKCDTVIMTNFKKNPQISRCRSKFKTKPQIITEITNGLDYNSDSSEEFKYGPGIVNKLKSKYMSMTIREQKPRPPLWRSNSMDNIVEDKNCPEKPKHTLPPDVINVSVNVKNETLKRARSMEVLSESHAINDNTNEQLVPKTGDLPPPDVVKTYKKIFENKTQNEVKPIKIKPAILPKPVLSPEKSRTTRMNKVPLKKMIQPIKYPNRLKKKEPLGLDRSKALINDEVSSSQDESSMSSDDGSSIKHRVVIKTTISGANNENKVVAVQAKQICVIRPTTRTAILSEETANAQLSDKEIEKNFLDNNNKSNGIKRIGGLWDKKRWDNNENSVVFNFVDRKGVPNYIDNEVPIFRRDSPCRVKNGCIMLDAQCEESSTDDVDNGSNGKYVIFIGGNIIIGRSNLRKDKSSSTRKNLRIQFSEVLETTHEYPSEASLLLDEEHDLAPSETEHNKNFPAVQPKNTFGNYTPSKLGTTEETFLGEYGVSRSSVIKNVKRIDNNDKTTTDNSVIDTNVPWSEETTPDLLF